MDFNDIDFRLKRIYQSVGDLPKHGLDVLLGIVYKDEKVTDTMRRLSISFGNGEDPAIMNRIMGIIYNIANLKDLLKERMFKDGKEKQLVEDCINSSLPLKLVLDLCNQDKHGYPLTQRRRSKLDPQIANLNNVLTQSSKPDNIEYFGPGGSMVRNMMIDCHADIVDPNMKVICTLDFMISESIEDWEDFIKDNQIL